LCGFGKGRNTVRSDLLETGAAGEADGGRVRKSAGEWGGDSGILSLPGTGKQPPQAQDAALPPH